MSSTIQLKRGTRSQINSLAAQRGLLLGEPLLIIDENRLAVATSTSSFEAAAKQGENVSGTTGVTSVSGTAPIASSGGTTPTISITEATTSAAGSMSAADKSKLDGIAVGATANTGTVTSVSGTGTVSGLTLSGTVTSSGNLTLGGILSVSPSNFSSQTTKTFLAAPNNSNGVPTFRTIVASDIPVLNQNTTGTASNVTGVVSVINGGTGASTQVNARANLLPSYTGNAGKVLVVNPGENDVTYTSLGGTGTVTSVGLSVPDFLTVNNSPITTSGTITIGFSGSALPVSNGGTGATDLTGVVVGNGTNAFTTIAKPTGTIVGTTDDQILTNKTITGLKEVRVNLAANDIDVNAGNYFTKTISTTTTFTVSNVPAAGTTTTFILDLTNGGSSVVTWWSGVKWQGGTAPTLTSSGRDILGFFTHDAGVTWGALLLAKDIK